jgi:hypothetical protein
METLYNSQWRNKKKTDTIVPTDIRLKWCTIQIQNDIMKKSKNRKRSLDKIKPPQRTVSENRWCGIVNISFPINITFLEVSRSLNKINIAIS